MVKINKYVEHVEPIRIVKLVRSSTTFHDKRKECLTLMPYFPGIVNSFSKNARLKILGNFVSDHGRKEFAMMLNVKTFCT